MLPTRIGKNELREIAAGKRKLPAANTQGGHWDKVTANLQKALKNVGLTGRVVSILVHLTEGRGGINAFGELIEPGRIFRALHLSAGMSTHTGCPRRGDVAAWKEGHFAPGKPFGLTGEGIWVALIGIPVSQAGLDKAVPFPQQPLT